MCPVHIQVYNSGELDDKQFGITPEMHCEVMFGGRGFPRISRDVS